MNHLFQRIVDSLHGAAVANAAEPSPGDLERVLKQNAKYREALVKISKFYITTDRGRFGDFIGAAAVEIAKEALTPDDSVRSK